MKLAVERRYPLFLFLIVLLGFGLRVYHLGYSAVWVDEGFTRFYSESSLSYLWTTGFHLENNPPGYFSLMHFWIMLFGASEFALRFFSVLASLVAIVLVYMLGKELESRSIGLIAALLMALSPTEIWFAQEARNYALLHVAVAAALLGMARYLGPARSLSGLTLYVVGAIGAVYCHDTALLFVLACNLAVLGMASYDRRFISLADLLRWLVANAVVGLAALPWVIAVLHHPESPDLQWIPPLTSWEFFWIIRDVIGGPAANREFLHGHSICYLFLIAVIGLLCWFRKLDQRELTLLVVAPLVFIVVVILISIHQTILISRIFFWTWIPLCLLLAHLLFHGRRTRLPLLGLITLIFVVGMTGLYFPSFPPKEDWRALMRNSKEELSQADVIVLTSSAATGSFAYYLPSAVNRLSFCLKDSGLPIPSITETYYHDRFGVPTIRPEELLRAIQSGKKVCVLVVNHNLDFFASQLAPLPPPHRRFDCIHPHAYELHVLSWNGTGLSEKRLDGQESSP